jgi:hypothetical protein
MQINAFIPHLSRQVRHSSSSLLLVAWTESLQSPKVKPVSYSKIATQLVHMDSYADEVRDHMSSHRANGDDDNGGAGHWTTTAKQMVVKSIPFMIAGAIAGLTVKSLSILGSHEKEKNRKKVGKFRHLSRDDGFIQLMDHVSKFAVVSPNWMPNFCGHMDNIFEIAENFDKLTVKVQRLTGLVDENTSDLSKLKSFDGALSYLFELLVPQEYYSKLPFAKSMQEDLEDKERQKKENVSEAFDLLKRYFDASATLIASAFKSRIAAAGLASELCETVTLFNEYRQQVGPTVLEDPARVYNGAAGDMAERKLALAKAILQHGFLPTRVQSIVEDDHTRASIKWWMSMDIMFLPQMITVAVSLNWKPPFDPNKKKRKRRRRGGRDDSDSDEEPGEYQHGLVEKGESSRNVPAGRRMPGYAFVESRDQAEARRKGEPTGQETAATFSRPSTSNSLYEQAKFWKSRMVGEKGLGGVLQQPWAGFTPSVNDESFLPTSRLNRSDLENSIMIVMDVINRKIEDMLRVQKFLLYQANKIGDLKTYYLDKVRRGEEDILDLHFKWQEWQQRGA